MACSLLKDENGILRVHHEWQNCDRDTLGKMFSPSRFSRLSSDPDEVIKTYLRQMDEGSTETRKRMICERNIPYGKKPSQILDLYLPEEVEEDAPVLVFIHGGYWQEMSAASHGSIARHLVPRGVVVALVGYTLAPEASMSEIIQECRDALAFCARRYPKSRGVFISGHSAGGHLTMMMLATDWQKDYDLPRGLIKGAVPISGIFDLRPLVPTYINDPLGMTSDSALQSSPIAHLPQIVKNCSHCKLVFIYGDHDPPSFKIQCQQFTQLLKEHGVDAPYIELEKADHFEILPNMLNEEDPSVKALLEIIFPSTNA